MSEIYLSLIDMQNKQVLLATAEMGYGHLRALYPFTEIPEYRLVILGQSDNSKPFERRVWRIALRMYESVSRFKNFPVIGWILFSLMNGFLRIPPRNKHLKSNRRSFPFWLLEQFIKMGLCEGVMMELKKSRSSLLTSFYAPVIAMSGTEGINVYCQICDADLSRVWVARHPKSVNTRYFAPCKSAVIRLRQYGVRPQMIYLTGFPFPHKLVGGMDEEIAKQNYFKRINLLDDPKRNSQEKPLEIAYVVGGAGALSEVGFRLADGLSAEILNGKVILYLVAGIKRDVIEEYMEYKEKFFPNCNNIQIIGDHGLAGYFNLFVDLISHVHVLWTKPSEIVFYSALGIPIIMTKPIGAQEEANREWVIDSRAGMDQSFSQNLGYWLLTQFHSGNLGRMAHAGWHNGLRTALYRIPDIIKKTSE